ncbi:MAG: NUDIX domain-containing protein [Bacteroidales bacterium]|nr:NUDIX domain-containing protein [Bacteroidales bacterium]
MELIYPASGAPFLPRPTYKNPGDFIPMEGERVPVVEPSGEVIGQTTRVYAHSGSRLLHPTVHLHILDREGRIFLQKRAATKELYPLRWDTAVAGHVIYRESILDALWREAEEEMGLTQFNPIFLRSYVYDNRKERELVSVFACIGNFSLTPNPDEVDQARWWTFDEVTRLLRRSQFTRLFEKQFPSIKDSLIALL